MFEGVVLKIICGGIGRSGRPQQSVVSDWSWWSPIESITFSQPHFEARSTPKIGRLDRV